MVLGAVSVVGTVGGVMATATSALVTAVGGATAAAATTVLTTAVSGATSVLTSALTVGAGVLPYSVQWAVLGVTDEQTSALYTFDCWKPVLHDESSEPSDGKFLREIVTDSRVKEVKIALNSTNMDLPHLVLKNIWNEEFRIDYLYLSSIGLAAHAVRI